MSFELESTLSIANQLSSFMSLGNIDARNSYVPFIVLERCREKFCVPKQHFVWVCRLAAVKHLVVVVVKRPETERASLACRRWLPPNGVPFAS